MAQGFLDAPGGGAADTLMDRERIPQWGGGLGGVAVTQVAVADALQSSCFLWGRAEVAGDGQGPGVAVAGLAAIGGPRR